MLSTVLIERLVRYRIQELHEEAHQRKLERLARVERTNGSRPPEWVQWWALVKQMALANRKPIL